MLRSSFALSITDTPNNARNTKRLVDSVWSCTDPEFISVIARLTKPSLSAPLQNFNTQHLLCRQRPPTMMFTPMKGPLSSPRTDVRRNSPSLFRGLKSEFCSLSSSQNHSHPRSYTLSHLRFITSCPIASVLMRPLQFVRNVGITDGDESRVGYYVGLMV